MNPQTRKIAPKTNARRKLSSAGALGLGPQVPIRSSSRVIKRLLQGVLFNRQLAEETKALQCHFEEILESCQATAHADLAKFVESKVNLNEIWQSTYGIPWNPTEENLRTLSQNFLQSCKLHIRAESIGRPDPRKVVRRFAVSVVTDICEFLSLVNIGLCFYWKEVSAGWILSGCVILERILQTILCMTLEGKSFTSFVASLLGVKTFLTSYFISCEGLLTEVEGSKLNLFQTRLIHKGINGIFISTPQLILNAYMLFSKLNEESDINTQMQIQIFFILAVSFSCGVSLTTLVQEHERMHSDRGFYKSLTQIHPLDGDEFGLVITKTCWNVCHFMLVTCGLGALIAKTPSSIWISLVIGFFIILNILRYIINEGKMQFYKRMDVSMLGNTILTMMSMILCVLGVGLMPLSVLRRHNLLTPTVFGVGWVSSFLISSVSVLCLSSNVILWVAFGCLSLLYVIAVYLYFRLLKPGAWKTFVWSNENWKDKLRNEFWESTYNSDLWEDIHLAGDKDAHYASMIVQYLETDLPWDKLTTWLKEKKTTFRNTPPSWLTIEWLDLLPKDVRTNVWDNPEYGDLKHRIREVEKAFSMKMSTKRRVFIEKPSKTNSAQGIITVKDDSVPDTPNVKSDKYLDKNTKMKIHPKYEKDLKNDSAADNDVSDRNPDKKDAKMKIHPKKENDLDDSSPNDTTSLDTPNLLRKREDVTAEKNDDGRKSDVIPEKDEDTVPNIVPNNGPEEEDERTKAIRKNVVENMRRRSSIGGSGGILPLQRNQKEEENIPSVLKELFEKAETMQVDEIREASKEAVDGELFAILLGPEKDATGEHIMLTILKGFLRQREKHVDKKNINEGVPRILLAAFFELFDEVSDIILAGLFYADTDNKRWAGHLMFTFMGLNRLVQGLFSLSSGESKWRVCEGFIGIKCITDTYRMIRDGPLAISGGRSLVTVRAFSLGIGMTCESLPQMMLQ
eukprot:g603.t1